MMKRLVVFFLLLIGVAGGAEAQKIDTLRNASIQKIYDLIKVKGKPLIVIDGFIYKADSKPFDTNDIVAIEMLHPPGSVNIYGKQAADGTILITTKSRSLDTADLVLPSIKKRTDLSGNYNHSLTATKINPTDSTTFDQLAKDSALFILDGVVSDKKLNGTLPKDILSINILRKDRSSEIFETQSRRDIVAVITKAGATKSYQIKLSKFSKEYKLYLDANHNDDSRITFIIDGTICPPSKDEGLNNLFDLNTDKIEKVEFSKGHAVASGSVPTVVFITTKQH